MEVTAAINNDHLHFELQITLTKFSHLSIHRLSQAAGDLLAVEIHRGLGVGDRVGVGGEVVFEGRYRVDRLSITVKNVLAVCILNLGPAFECGAHGLSLEVGREVRQFMGRDHSP